MHEKTLLYAALAFTAVAAGFGVYKARESPATRTQISPVPLVDANRNGLLGADVPIRLTSSDGTGLKLVGMRAAAAIEDPLALTELHLTFENPENRVLEGTFRITLPEGASLSRFAMRVGNVWQEGEVVEKQAARQAYEDFLHRKQDPALMEQGGGNEFSARVFPIPARGKKEIIIAYSSTLEAGGPYTLPLRGLPMLGALDIDVHAEGTKGANGGRPSSSFGLHQCNFTPAEDFVVSGKEVPRSGGLRSGDVAVARVVPFASSRPELISSAVFLVDTSASRGLGLPEEARLLAKVVGKLVPSTTITVACFDQEVVEVFKGKAGDFGEKETNAIIERGALGASNFEEALGWAAEHAKKDKAKRVVLIGDGVATAGETDAQKLRDKIEKLRDAGVDRIDAVAVGGIRDAGFLRTVVRGVLDRDGVVLDGALGDGAIARRLEEATSSGVPVKVEGASWTWPDKLDGLQAGDEVLVYAKVQENGPVKITVGTQEMTPDLRLTERPLVERAWAQAKIQSLVEAPTQGAAETKRDIVSLSTHYRVLSPQTAMLVLETDRDYQRFGIDRNANLDILAVANGHVTVMHAPRSEEEKLQAAQKNEQAHPLDRAKGRADKAAESAASHLNDDGEQTTRPSAGGATPEAPAQAGPAATATTMPTPTPRPDVTTEPALREDDLRQGTRRGIAPGADLTEAPPPPAEHRSEAPGLVAPTPVPAPPTVQRDPAPALSGYFGGNGSGASPARPSSRPRGNEQADRQATAQVRPATLVVSGGTSEAEVQRVIRRSIPRMTSCFANLPRDPNRHGRITAGFLIDGKGAVTGVSASGVTDEALKGCVTNVVRSLQFATPAFATTTNVTASFDFVNGDGNVDSVADTNRVDVPKALPYQGRFKTVMEDLARGEKDSAVTEAQSWKKDQPGDVMAFVALGEAYEAKGDIHTAARAYGSILELFSFRADSRRFAGERLERLKDAAALRLAADTYGKAAEQRPDHPASHRLYAFALVKAGQHEKAFEAMRKGASRTYPSGRFRGVDRILKEDLGLIAAAWASAEPGKRTDIMNRLHAAGGIEENGPSLRFVLVWETDANDVDFHIHDGKGGHAYYGQKQLASGGELYADVTTGYGPECFTIRGARDQRAYPYTLQAHYYSRGPMGYGMGKLEIVDHDGKGHLTFEERPFIVMIDRAYVDLGTVDKPKAGGAVSLK